MDKIQNLSFSEDVRHLTPDTALTWAGLYNATKPLEDRDNECAAKINEVIDTLNKVSFVAPIVFPRVTMSPLTELILGNFAIPTGHSASIVQANVASSPKSKGAVLKILFSNGTFGETGSNVGSMEIASTATSVSSIGEFAGGGELIFRLASNAVQTISAVVSVTIALRQL